MDSRKAHRGLAGIAAAVQYRHRLVYALPRRKRLMKASCDKLKQIAIGSGTMHGSLTARRSACDTEFAKRLATWFLTVPSV